MGAIMKCLPKLRFDSSPTTVQYLGDGTVTCFGAAPTIVLHSHRACTEITLAASTVNGNTDVQSQTGTFAQSAKMLKLCQACTAVIARADVCSNEGH